MSKIFPVLLPLESKIIGGGDFSQGPKEDRDPPDIVSGREPVDILPRHELVPNVDFVEGFEDLFRLRCVLCHSFGSLLLGQMVVIFRSSYILVPQGSNLNFACGFDSNYNKIEISDWYTSFVCFRMKDDSSHWLII